MDSRHRDAFELEAQARAFEGRAGLPPPVARAVAECVHALCPGRLLEVGAGTGEVGARLAELHVAQGYVALDRSAAMLARFREGFFARAPEGALRPTPAPALVIADAGERWPFRDACFAGVFMARVAHLLDAQKLGGELMRVLGEGACVLIGRRRRDPDSVRSILRRELRRLLAEHGYEPRAGGNEALALHEQAPELRGPERVSVARWSVAECPGDALRAWHAKPGLSGTDISAADRRQILSSLEVFARTRFGADLELPRESEQNFVIDVLVRRTG